MQEHDVLAPERRVELLNAVDVDDRRPMDADEVPGVELRLDVSHRAPHEVRLRTDVKPDVFFNQVGLLRRPDWEFKQRGRSGLWVSELFPHLATVADDLTVIRSMTADSVSPSLRCASAWAIGASACASGAAAVVAQPAMPHMRASLPSAWVRARGTGDARSRA